MLRCIALSACAATVAGLLSFLALRRLGALKFYSWDAAHTPVYAYNTGNKVLHLEVGGKVYDLFPNAAPLRIE